VPILPPVVVLAALFSAPAAADDPTGLVNRVRPSVVTLQTVDLLGRPSGNGTGFLISSDGLVVTNHHVAVAGPSVAVMFDGTRHAVMGLLVSDEASDVAILRIEGSGYPALPLGAPVAPAVRDRVMVIGSPRGLDQTVSEGEITALRPDGLPPEAGETAVARTSLLQINADIAPGSSGSPVLTLDGNVIGVAQSANTEVDSYFAVDVAAVKTLQARAPADGALTPLDSPLRQLLSTLGLVVALVALAVTPGLVRRSRDWLRVRRHRRGRAASSSSRWPAETPPPGPSRRG
jgi:S1-C subfamily serine protease